MAAVPMVEQKKATATQALPVAQQARAGAAHTIAVANTLPVIIYFSFI
jgi:hypothetical protein